MDVNKILAELKQEKQRIEEAILALQSAGANGQPRRGRPPKWLADARQQENGPKKKGRPRKAS